MDTQAHAIYIYRLLIRYQPSRLLSLKIRWLHDVDIINYAFEVGASDAVIHNIFTNTSCKYVVYANMLVYQRDIPDIYVIEHRSECMRYNTTDHEIPDMRRSIDDILHTGNVDMWRLHRVNTTHLHEYNSRINQEICEYMDSINYTPIRDNWVQLHRCEDLYSFKWLRDIISPLTLTINYVNNSAKIRVLHNLIVSDVVTYHQRSSSPQLYQHLMDLCNTRYTLDYR